MPSKPSTELGPPSQPFLRFGEARVVESAKALTALQKDQLRAAGEKYDGEDVSAERRLSASHSDEANFAKCELRPVRRDHQVVIEAWFFRGDSGSLFLTGTCKEIAGIAQGELECNDPDLERELGAALVEAKLLSPRDSEYRRFEQELLAQSQGKRAPAALVASSEAKPAESTMASRLTSALGEPDRRKKRAAIERLRDEVFNCGAPAGKDWKTFPKRRPDSLTADERAVLEAMLEWGGPIDLAYQGLFDRDEHVQRFLGLNRGPSDFAVRIDGQDVPLWCVVSDVASNHVPAERALSAFATLGKAEAVGAWLEVASGQSYDVWDPHYLTFKEAGINASTPRIEYWTRLIDWLTQATLRLSKEGADAAVAAAEEAIGPWERKRTSDDQQLFSLIACDALRIHGLLDDPRWAPLREAVEKAFHSKAIQQRILEAWPATP